MSSDNKLDIMIVVAGNRILGRLMQGKCVMPMGGNIKKVSQLLNYRGFESAGAVINLESDNDERRYKVSRYNAKGPDQELYPVELTGQPWGFIQYDWFTWEQIEESGAEIHMVPRQMIQAVMGKL